ncbi:MAG: DUF3892 domain-containing protein [Candidatus Thermoplasmatota archaeon]
MGEYWITHVKKKDDKHIEQVKALMNTVEGLTNPVKYNRDQVVESIQKGDDWYTCMLKEKKNAKNVWEKTSEVHTVKIDGDKFIRTDRNKKKEDNLGKLPQL